MTKANEHIQVVKEMIYGNAESSSMLKAREIFTRVKDEVTDIQNDKTLSEIGIAQKQREAKERGDGRPRRATGAGLPASQECRRKPEADRSAPGQKESHD